MPIETKSSTEILSYSQRRKGFHEKYLSICKAKILQPLPEVKNKQKNIHVLDFHADRIKVNDWIAICDALRNDRTLKQVNIRLRKNDEYVLENVDTLKKTKSLTSLPVIYSKFLLSEFVESLHNMLICNNFVEIFSIEGFPLRDRYMMPLAKGLFSNRSIRVLNLSRSKIGDDGCEMLCSNIKHLGNIETLNLSLCNIGVKGVHAIRDYIKTQKIHRFSEAWIRSLRYQNIESTSFGGLKRIFLNNNPQIGDEGLKILIDELCEDVWIKDIEMQNCGLSDIAGNEIINCLNLNKTILSFNVANNCDLPDHLFRQILMRLGSSDSESCDSNDSKSNVVKITKNQLFEKIKYLEDQLESEIFLRKQSEELIEQLQRQNEESLKQINILNNQELQNIPQGFTLMANDELDRLIFHRKTSIVHKTSSNIAVRLRRRRRNPIKRVKSLVIENPINKVVTSKSMATISSKYKRSEKRKDFIERNIGDGPGNRLHYNSEEDDDDQYDGAKVLEMMIKKETKTRTNVRFESFFQKFLNSSLNDSETESDSS